MWCSRSKDGDGRDCLFGAADGERASLDVDSKWAEGEKRRGRTSDRRKITGNRVGRLKERWAGEAPRERERERERESARETARALAVVWLREGAVVESTWPFPD
jgi:hypothetical protein